MRTQILGSLRVGGGEEWTPQSKKEFVLNLNRGIPEDQTAEAGIRISTNCEAADCSWDSTLTVTGISADGVESELVRPDRVHRFGGMHSNQESWQFQNIGK